VLSSSKWITRRLRKQKRKSLSFSPFFSSLLWSYHFLNFNWLSWVETNLRTLQYVCNMSQRKMYQVYQNELYVYPVKAVTTYLKYDKPKSEFATKAHCNPRWEEILMKRIFQEGKYFYIPIVLFNTIGYYVFSMNVFTPFCWFPFPF